MGGGHAESCATDLAHVALTFESLVAGTGRPPWVAALAIPVFALAVAGVVAGWFGGARRAALLGAVWMIVPPLALTLMQVVTGKPGVLPRYWLFCLPAIALCAGLALDWLWSRGRVIAIAGAVGLCVLAAPSQVAARGINGHQGWGWLDLPQVLALPKLADAPLLVSISYRALAAVDPSLTSRMPLIIDPGPSGRVNPQRYGPNWAPFRALIRDHNLVVVLQSELGYRHKLPTREAFRSFPAALRVFPEPAVLCNWFGDPLGVFTKPTATMTPAEAQQLAEQITEIEPSRAKCAPGPASASP